MMEIVDALQTETDVFLNFEGEGGRAEIRVHFLGIGYGGSQDWSVSVIAKPLGERINRINVGAGSIKGRDSLSWIATRWACMFLGIRYNEVKR